MMSNWLWGGGRDHSPKTNIEPILRPDRRRRRPKYLADYCLCIAESAMEREDFDDGERESDSDFKPGGENHGDSARDEGRGS